MAPLSSISIISWSINNSCVLDIFSCFGIVLCAGTFKKDITYFFTTDKISWSWVSFSQFLLKWVNLSSYFSFGIFPVNKFFAEGEHLLETVLESVLEIFWTREPVFDPELWFPAPFIALFSIILRVVSASTVRFFTAVKLPFKIRFAVR